MLNSKRLQLCVTLCKRCLQMKNRTSVVKKCDLFYLNWLNNSSIGFLNLVVVGRPNRVSCIYFCHVVMLNSIQDPIRIIQTNLLFATGTFANLVLLKAYNSIHKFDIIDIHLRLDKACVIFLKLFTNFFLLAN